MTRRPFILKTTLPKLPPPSKAADSLEVIEAGAAGVDTLVDGVYLEIMVLFEGHNNWNQGIIKLLFKLHPYSCAVRILLYIHLMQLICSALLNTLPMWTELYTLRGIITDFARPPFFHLEKSKEDR